MQRVKIRSIADQWGSIRLYPSSIFNIFRDMRTAEATLANHKLLHWTDHLNNISGQRKPYGYNHWISDGVNDNAYEEWTVLGSKITITVMPNAYESTGDTWLGGFSKLHATSSANGMLFGDQFNNINFLELEDLLNTRVSPQMKVFSANTRSAKRLGQSFTFNYSKKKWRARMKKHGYQDSDDWVGTYATDPNILPQVNFIISDMAQSSTAHVFYCMMNIEYTVQLSGLKVADKDTS